MPASQLAQEAIAKARARAAKIGLGEELASPTRSTTASASGAEDPSKPCTFASMDSQETIPATPQTLEKAINVAGRKIKDSKTALDNAMNLGDKLRKAVEEDIKDAVLQITNRRQSLQSALDKDEAEGMEDLIAHLNDSLKIFDDAALPAKKAKKAK